MEKILISLLFGVLGLVLGSFSSVLISRLFYDEKGILWGRSKCGKCGKVLEWKNLIPLLSFLWQKGKCSFCGKKISWFYFLIEIVFGGVFFLFVFNFFENFQSLNLEFFMSLILISFALILGFYDGRFFIVDRRIVWPAILLALNWAFFRGFFGDENILNFLIGGLIGFLFFYLQYVLTRGKGIGLGDAELGIFMGLVFGWMNFLVVLFAAYILATFILLPFLILEKVNKKSRIPLGAFLMGSVVIFLIFGDSLFEWYFGLIDLT